MVDDVGGKKDVEDGKAAIGEGGGDKVNGKVESAVVRRRTAAAANGQSGGRHRHCELPRRGWTSRAKAQPTVTFIHPGTRRANHQRYPRRKMVLAILKTSRVQS